MDPITTAIVAALAKLSEGAIQDAYGALKKLIKRKLGERSDVADAVDRLEQKPDSAGRRATLEEEVAAAGAPADDELVAAARDLIARIEAAPGGSQVITEVRQEITGDRNVVSGTGNVTVHESPKP